VKPDVLRGHLDGMVLSVLEGEPLHGYAVMEALQHRSGGTLDLPTGTLYPALRRAGRLPAQRVEHGRWPAAAYVPAHRDR
jgi:DNA-binding PadR family transcriptional regulator